MPSMKAIKRRRMSVSSISQIMKAMDLVAASKLQRAKERLVSVRPLVENTGRVMDSVRASDQTTDNIFVREREVVRRSAFVVITGDRGLCGGYNTNAAKEALRVMKDKNEIIIAVGKKGYEYFRRQRKNLSHRHDGVSDALTYADAQKIRKLLTELYTSADPEKRIDEAYIVYTGFEGMLTHIPKAQRLLPIGSVSGEEADTTAAAQMEYEPDINTFLEHAIPMYLEVCIYGAMLESAVCEHAARMMSMEAASKNAEEIIEDLTLSYNRARQGAITQELNEIVSGANALV
ncbi:MAG: ATP synthase F1 subunit gamma [Oscillospiraceae bacterium]|nr:ATP synthase F1 subunit gamma [Oscillospiraceae bacterium]